MNDVHAGRIYQSWPVLNPIHEPYSGSSCQDKKRRQNQDEVRTCCLLFLRSSRLPVSLLACAGLTAAAATTGCEVWDLATMLFWCSTRGRRSFFLCVSGKRTNPYNAATAAAMPARQHFLVMLQKGWGQGFRIISSGFNQSWCAFD